jgi:hypothetical protein
LKKKIVHRDEERTDTTVTLLEQCGVLLLEGLHATDAAADDDADPLGVGTLVREPGRSERLMRGDDRELDEAVHPLRLLAVEHTLEREVLHLTGEPRLVIGRVESRDGSGSGLAFDQGLPAGLDVVPDR